MKKRMFLSTILMTLVLLLAVTTATFAWYEVTSSGTANLAATAEELGTLKGTYEAKGVNLVGDITTTDSVALSDSNGVSWVWVNGNLVVATNDETLLKVGEATLSISWPEWEEGMTEQEIMAEKLAVSGTYTVTIQGNRVKLSKSNEAESKAYKSTAGAAIELTVTILDGNITIENDGVFYFAVAGEGAENNKDGETVKTFGISAVLAPAEAQ